MEGLTLRRVRFIKHEILAKMGSFLQLDKYEVTYPAYRSGKMEGPYDRVNVYRKDAVAGLLHIRQAGRDYLLLVEQFRLPTLIDNETGMPDMEKIHGTHSEGAGRFVELMAGMQKPGEPWKETFRRECREETGLEPRNVEFISSFYPSPGACSEQIHLYYGRVDWPAGRPVPGSENIDDMSYGDETEDIRPIALSPDDFIKDIEDGTIKDAKCLVAVEWMRRPSSVAITGIKLTG